jgi:anti-anti-sigma regulatory factor
MSRPFSWNPSEHVQGQIDLHGEINEHTDLDALASSLRGPTTLNAGDVDSINSIGVRTWIRFARRCHADGVQLTLVALSPVLVAQMNMIPAFAGGAKVRSVLAPFVCPACYNATATLIDLDGDVHASLAVPVPCVCGAAMEFDDLPELYLAFRSAG